MKCKLCGSHEDVHEIYISFDTLVPICRICISRIAGVANNRVLHGIAETLTLSAPWIPMRGFTRYEINASGFVRVVESGCVLLVTLGKHDYGRYTLTDRHGERVSRWLSDLLYRHFNKRRTHVFHIYATMRRIAREENQRNGINSYSRTYLRG